MPEKNEIYPERIQIIQDLQLEAIDTSDLGEADGSH